MTKHGFILLLNLLISVAAQDLEPITTESIANNNNVNNPLEILENIDPLDTLDPTLENVPTDFLISWQARRSLRRILAQMPCGWPQYDVPPLAPYENDNFSFQLENSVFKTVTDFTPLRIDGLNNMEINRLQVGIIFKRINFDFNFPNITLTGNFDTTTTMNLEEFIATKFLVKGSGKLNLSLNNLRISGNLKYKWPIFSGSPKITTIKTQISLGNVNSELSGSINGVPIGEQVNDFIITKLLTYLNEHDFLWNGLIEKHLLPLINTQLEGKTLWNIFLWSISRNENTCTPEDYNYMDILELNQLLLKKPLIANENENSF